MEWHWLVLMKRNMFDRRPTMLSNLAEELEAARLQATCVRQESPLYKEVLALAALAYSRPIDQVASTQDALANMYILTRDGTPIGTITVAQARRGQLEQECFLPRDFLFSFRRVLCEAYRLAVHPELADTFRTARLLMRVSFSDGIADGMRIALAGTKPELVRYYRRAGYVRMAIPPFVHPRLFTPHVLVSCPVDPNRRSFFKDLCLEAADALPIAQLGKYLQNEEGDGADGELESLRKRL